MLRIYPVALSVTADAARIAETINRQDSDLARQLRRAATSVALNIAEGSYSQGKNRRARYFNALGSARETLACIEVAAAAQFATQDPEVTLRLNHIIGTLVRLTR